MIYSKQNKIKKIGLSIFMGQLPKFEGKNFRRNRQQNYNKVDIYKDGYPNSQSHIEQKYKMVKKYLNCL